MGLAVGDAVGTTLEFKSPGSFEPISDMVGGGPFNLLPGQWTDDTSMALCLAESLIEQQGFDSADQMSRYVHWWCEGHLSSNGRCFDIGGTVRSALSRFEASGEPYSGSTEAYSAGNGSIMRLIPIPLFFANDPGLAIKMSGESSRTTHGTTAAIDACRFLGALLVGALQGTSKSELLSGHYTPVSNYWEINPLMTEIDAIAAGFFKEKEPPDIKGTGYVVKSLEAGLWAFHNSRTFEEGCLLAVNLGDDADTTGAIYGQLAGAFYSVKGIPGSWCERITMRDKILGFADALHTFSRNIHSNHI